ncbi:hypothetical protein DAPK24_037950 [Pichia kluyveri]|uniref:Myb-like domain-containing protein n=1 Tax=Pichia kluyveri TaxID=36015 RepID=A0AAV5R7E6_PICKL|nr:hypothetical protein DAPK24_037950 [Pichia kluyveri]
MKQDPNLQQDNNMTMNLNMNPHINPYMNPHINPHINMIPSPNLNPNTTNPNMNIIQPNINNNYSNSMHPQLVPLTIPISHSIPLPSIKLQNDIYQPVPNHYNYNLNLNNIASNSPIIQSPNLPLPPPSLSLPQLPTATTTQISNSSSPINYQSKQNLQQSLLPLPPPPQPNIQFIPSPQYYIPSYANATNNTNNNSNNNNNGNNNSNGTMVQPYPMIYYPPINSEYLPPIPQYYTTTNRNNNVQNNNNNNNSNGTNKNNTYYSPVYEGAPIEVIDLVNPMIKKDINDNTINNNNNTNNNSINNNNENMDMNMNFKNTANVQLNEINWDTKRGSKSWSKQEDRLLLRLKDIEKMNWVQISNYFPGRTTNGCQFRWRRLTGRAKSKKFNK